MSGSTNVMLRRLIYNLNKQKKPLWRRVAELLESPSRKRIYINLYKINKYTKAGDVVIVPGKVLGIGKLDHEVTIVALDFSSSAKKKISEANGKLVSLYNFDSLDLKGKYVRLMRQ
ncbi:50S ribosomal protein L18e [Acidianus sulfidivorans JP7]|uniref:Large ribosomal subunit protein eL18 n=1 Tax=Acidianus sulfidivorans JP7 TaxID=619593 RepID=A0A2U9IM59_9CREN|nr:50S ribosomal protein L18e [Acidianus sulfidivorans JP7]